MRVITKIKQFLRPIKVLYDLGYFLSLIKGQPITLEGNPLPWLTYPAIDFLQRLNLKGKSIFEFGSGNSTLFWIEKCAKSIVSVENDITWYNHIRSKINSIVEIHYIKNEDDYVNKILEYGNNFDVILIDGELSRYKSAINAIKKLKDGGIIILDNSNHYIKTATLLRQSGLIQVDMSGFGPASSAIWTTSFFFSRTYNLKIKIESQSINPIGGTIPSEQERKRIEGL